MNYDKLMNLVMKMAKKMLEDGAEVSRVENSIERILANYGAKDHDVFAISTHISISAEFEGKSYSKGMKVTKYEFNFYQLDELNALSRIVCTGDISIEEFEKRYNDIVNEPSYPIWKTILGSVICVSAFCVFFGGDWLDAIIAGILGVVLVLANRYIRPLINVFLHTILVSYVIGLLGGLAYKIGICHNVDSVLIGTVMLLIPGIALTNAIRDLFLGDIISGCIKFVESIVVALCIGIGYGFGMLTVFGQSIQVVETTNPWWLVFIVGIIASYGYGMMFHMRGKKLWLTAIGVALTWATYMLFDYLTDIPFLEVMPAAVVACCFGEIMARIQKTPAIINLTIAVIPLYPGGSLFYTLYNLVVGNTAEFNARLGVTGYKVLAIASGIIIGSVLFRYVHRFINFLVQKKNEREGKLI